MADEFTGEATPFSADAIERAAVAIGCEVAAVRAVIRVESSGGFLPDGRPRILFERHYFSRLTKGRHDRTDPDISGPRRGGYVGGAAEYRRLARAIALDRRAALRSASWGAFQIMGDNFRACGFRDVEAFVRAMSRSEDRQLDAFVAFVRSSGLADELCRRDWAGFARGYNGPDFRANQYDRKLEAAYILYAIGAPRARPAVRALRMGDQGADVAALQRMLGLDDDGDFGPVTKKAVLAHQRRNGLQADGIAGRDTVATLG